MYQRVPTESAKHVSCIGHAPNARANCWLSRASTPPLYHFVSMYTDSEWFWSWSAMHCESCTWCCKDSSHNFFAEISSMNSGPLLPVYCRLQIQRLVYLPLYLPQIQSVQALCDTWEKSFPERPVRFPWWPVRHFHRLRLRKSSRDPSLWSCLWSHLIFSLSWCWIIIHGPPNPYQNYQKPETRVE